jgi:hypothetical protein
METYPHMVNFSEFELARLAKVMVSLRGKIERTEYFEKGTVLERAVAKYSDGQLARVNGEGLDFEDIEGVTYEQKIVNISEKPRGGPLINGFIIKNWRGKERDFSESMLADYYIFLDIYNLKMCVVPKSFIKIKSTNSANVTASCDPLPSHFVELPEVSYDGSFFAQKEDWVRSFLESVPC